MYFLRRRVCVVLLFLIFQVIASDSLSPCGLVHLCFYIVPNEKVSYPISEVRRLTRNGDEIAYALQGLAPIWTVTKLDNRFSSQDVINYCVPYAASNGLLNPAVLILQSSYELPESAFTPFKSTYVVGSVSNNSAHALRAQPYVTYPSLSVTFDSSPIDFARKLKAAIGKQCDVGSLVPSPSPSAGPRKCNMRTICSYQMFEKWAFYYDTSRIKNITDDIYSQYVGPTSVSWISHLSSFTNSFQSVIDVCYGHTSFRNPTVIVLTTDVRIPSYLLDRYKSKIIFAIVNLDSNNINAMKSHIFDTTLSVDYQTVSGKALAKQIDTAIENFCSSRPPQTPTPTPFPIDDKSKSCGNVMICAINLYTNYFSFLSTTNDYEQIQDEIKYALDSQSSYGVYTSTSAINFTDSQSGQQIIQRCKRSQSDLFKYQSVIIFQSGPLLPESYLSQFQSDFIVSSINTNNVNAIAMKPFVSRPSLSAYFKTISPIQFANEIKEEVESNCAVPALTSPSPSPSNSPRKCNLITICQHRFFLNSNQYDQNTINQFSTTAYNLGDALVREFPSASFGRGPSSWTPDFVLEDVVDHCQRKRELRSPTVIILETDILVPPQALNRFKSDYIIAILNFNTENVGATKPYVFNSKLSVDFRDVSVDDFSTDVREAIQNFCSSSRSQLPTAAPSPPASKEKQCGYIGLCFYTPWVARITQPNQLAYEHYADEVTYALRGLFPIHSVRKQLITSSGAAGRESVVNLCYKKPSDVFSNPSILILQSFIKLPESEVTLFKSKFILGAILNNSTNARYTESLVSDASLSVVLDSEPPVDFAKKLKAEMGKHCDVDSLSPSPSPSGSPRKCNLRTFCDYKMFRKSYGEYSFGTGVFHDTTEDVYSYYKQIFSDSSYARKVSFNSDSFQDVIDFCYRKTFFQNPTVILLTTDIAIPSVLLDQYKSKIIFAILNVNSNNVNSVKPHIFDPALSVDNRTVSKSTLAKQIDAAVQNFCSSTPPPTFSPLPLDENKKHCGAVTMCIITDSSISGSRYRFIVDISQIVDETFHVLEEQLPYPVREPPATSATSRYQVFQLDNKPSSVQKIIDHCETKSTDLYKKQSVLVFLSDRLLQNSFISQFKSKFIVSSINTDSQNAIEMRPFFSRSSLSASTDTISPTSFAAEIQEELESNCLVPKFTSPSPSPSDSPRKCNLITICQIRVVLEANQADARRMNGLFQKTFDLNLRLKNLFQSASHVTGYSSFYIRYQYPYSSFSLPNAVAYCQQKKKFRTPTVIIIATDILLPLDILNEYKRDYIIGIVNFNAEYVEATKAHIFDPNLSVFLQTMSINNYVDRISSSIDKFCSSNRESIAVPTPTPNFNSMKPCGFITLCYIYTKAEDVSPSGYRPFSNEFEQLNDEITYALRADLPLYRVRTYTSNGARSNKKIARSCRSSSSDIYNISTIVVMQSDKALDGSLFTYFKRHSFIIGSINVLRTNAETITPHVSDPSLSVDLNSISPLDFAISIKNEVQNICQLSRTTPSPTPSRSPKKCSLTTVCIFRIIVNGNRYEKDIMKGFEEVSFNVRGRMINGNPDASFVYGFSDKSLPLADIVQFCQTKKVFRSPTVIILETDYEFGQSELTKYKSDYIIAGIGVLPEVVDDLKPYFYDPTLAVTYSEVQPESYSQYIGDAIDDFCSTSSVPITQLSPSPSPMFGSPVVRVADDLREFQVGLPLEENAQTSKDSAELFIFEELRKLGHNVSTISEESTGISSSFLIGTFEQNEATTRQSTELGHEERIQYRNRVEYCEEYRCAVRVTATSNRVIKKYMIKNSLKRLEKRKGFKEVFDHKNITYKKWSKYKWRIQIPYCNIQCRLRNQADA